MINKKWILLIFLVAWTGQPQSQVVPCPNIQPMTDQAGISYTTACIATQIKSEQREFKTKKEAIEFLGAIRTLVDKNAVFKEVKEKK